MKTHQWNSFILILLLSVIIFDWSEARAADEHIPEGVVMQAEFSPGYGEPLGIFKKTIGRVVLIHSADTLGYWAANDLPLYMKDRVITPEEGLALLQFLDESTISVAADSELVINRFIFDPDKFDRSTFLSLNTGRSRFWVKKFKDFARSEFKVKTETLIAGVRGSDFVIETGHGSTEITTLDDTELEVVSLAAPDRVTVLRSFERVRVNVGQPASPVERITPEDAARLRHELPVPADRGVMDTAGGPQAEAPRDTTRRTADATPVLDVAGQPVNLIPRNDLVEPIAPLALDTGAAGLGSETEWFDRSLPAAEPERITEQANDVIDTAIEEEILAPLPNLPGTP